MKIKILFILLLCICIYLLVNSELMEQFLNIYGSNMIEFTRLNGSLIKKFKISSSLSLYDREVINLFNQDDIIQINIPKTYFVKIIYKFKNASKGFGQTIKLTEGVYDIHKYINNKIIYQIDILKIFQSNINFRDLLLSDNIYYPSTYTTIPYYYNNFPRYKLYPPSKRLLQLSSYFNPHKYNRF
jgi:hypothetical protein